MGSLLSRLRGGAEPVRSITTIDDYIARVEQTGLVKADTIGPEFVDFSRGGYMGNGVVFSCMDVRQKVFSAVRFRWQRVIDGKPSDKFGTADLGVLERPWPGGTTQDLLASVLNHADLAGSAYTIRDGNELVRLRPDWVYIAVEERRVAGGFVGYRKVGYVYYEGGKHSGKPGVAFHADEVAHFMPIPDPLTPFRGMSWLTPIVREVRADATMNLHKERFFENGATPNMIIKHPPGADRDKVLDWVKRLEAQSAGTENAGKTLNLYPGADATVVGGNLQQADFKSVQGAGETRIAAAAGVPPVIVGLSEGLQAATYSNYSQARRRFADGTMHPLWQNIAGSLEVLLPAVGKGVRLTYDASDVPFLREDEKDAAEIAQTEASTIASLLSAGYTPESVIAAMDASDWRQLKHTGLFSVQLQKPGDQQPAIEGVPNE